jgi:hypothetical protein
MPLYEDTEEAPTNPKQDVVQAFKPTIKTAVIDTRYTPQSDQIAYIEGSSWVVDYYSQILDANDELNGQDTSAPAPLRQYKRIWSMELKVVQDLSQVSQGDPGNQELVVQGSANVYPFLVPQVGDMFRAGIPDGREGIFKVTRSERRQMTAETVHVIEYQLVAANDQARIFDLEQKTIVTYYFVKDFLLNLQNPLLEEETYHASKKLEVFYYDMIHLYFTQFFSRETMTLVVPEQKGYTYDHGITDFVKAIMNSFDDVHISSIRQLNIGDDGAISAPSLWTMLERRDPKLMKFITTKTGLVGRKAFHRSALLAGMRYTGIERIVYPLDAKRGVDYHYGKEYEKPVMDDNILSTMPAYVPPGAPEEGQVGLMPVIKPVDMAQSYVLSTAFYTRANTGLSLLEKLTLEYLDFKIIDATNVLKLCEDSYDWGPVEKFYYFPIVLMLIRYNLRRL